MKYLAALLLLFTLSSLKANDTLTMAQAYNFSVGDTFDYRMAETYPTGPYTSAYVVSFERDIVVYEWSDSMIHLVKHVHIVYDTSQTDYLDTTVLTYPSQYAFYSDTLCSTATYMPVNCYIISSSGYNGRLLNANTISCLESGITETGFCSGLGQVYFFNSNDGDGEGNETDSTYLIYFAKGAERWGTPYYVADGQTLLHFTPIPETCAVWTDTVAGWENQPGITAAEQIKTGDRIPFHGHTYVEMIYTAYNYADNHFTSDSLIGYFRNDTINKQTLFYYTLSDTSFFAYNFNQPVDGNICVAIDTVSLNSERRTRWTYGNYPFGNTYFQTIQYVEGMGGLNGLIPVYHPCGYLGGQQSPYVCTFGTLTCFSICGQTIYPNDSSGACPVVSGINQLQINPTGIRLFPTLNDGQFQVDVENGYNYKLIVSDILGREVLNSKIQAGSNFMSLKNRLTGMYFWRVMDNSTVVQTGRFVVAAQH